MPSIVSINYGVDNEVIVTVDPQMHIDYGFAYPLTYEFEIPTNSTDLNAFKKYLTDQDWAQITEKSSDEFFNAVEVVRFDYITNKAYISVGFDNVSDSIFMKITDSSSANVNADFQQICKYYDNRDAAVAMSADDMAGWSRSKFENALYILRNYHLWVTCAINTNGANSSTYRYIQAQLDSGYVEAGNHSRSHPHIPYDDYYSEVIGCKEDIINNLDLPSLFRNGNREYVYIWIAPYGENDAVIDSLLSLNKFLVNRLYYDGFDGFSSWNSELSMYDHIGVTREVGPFWVGTHDSTDLNNAFDEVITNGSVYHLMCHPNVIEWDKAYTWSHLNHISNHKNIWYVALGHLFVYHLAQENYITPTFVANKGVNTSTKFFLDQNYPNPFNPKTTITYQLDRSGHVRLTIYNALGQLVEELLSEVQLPGLYRIQWDASNRPSGIYLYQIQTDGFIENRKMLLIK